MNIDSFFQTLHTNLSRTIINFILLLLLMRTTFILTIFLINIVLFLMLTLQLLLKYNFPLILRPTRANINILLSTVVIAPISNITTVILCYCYYFDSWKCYLSTHQAIVAILNLKPLSRLISWHNCCSLWRRLRYGGGFYCLGLVSSETFLLSKFEGYYWLWFDWCCEMLWELIED